MSYFVTGATGFIGRHLVERLLEREGDIYVLVREGSEDKLERLQTAAGDQADRLKPVTGDISQPGLGLSDEDKQALKGVDHFFHLAAIYDITADDEERNRRLNVLGTQNAVDLANELGAKRFHYASSIAVAGEHDGLFTEDDFDVEQKLDAPVPPDQVRGREARPPAGQGPVARLPPGDRRRRLADRRDGQDRRPLLLLQGDPEGPPRAAGVVPARRARGRQDEHRPGRLRRRRDGPHRARGRARRPGLPPRQPEDAEGRRRHEHVRERRPRPAHGHAGRQADDRHAPEGRPVLRDEAAGAEGHPALGAGRHRRPRRGARVRLAGPELRRPRHASARSRARASSCRRSRATPTSSGTTGSATSTPTCSRTARSRAPSTARR